MNGARDALSVLDLIRNGFDWSGRTARLPYLIVTLVAMGLALLIPATSNFSTSNTAVFVALTMVFPVWLGHTRRRLRDVGWSGWWMWLAVLPVVSLVMMIFLSIKPGDDFQDAVGTGYSRLAFAASLLCGAAMLSRAFWAPYWIPAGSMKPSLLVGDFIAVIPVQTPERGDILVYRHPRTGSEHIERLIGLPGDRIELRAGLVILNEKPLPQSELAPFVEPYAPQGPARAQPICAELGASDTLCVKRQALETLPNGRQYAVLDAREGPADTTGLYTVGADELFFLGDNRDNANDSRFDPTMGGAGLIPVENVTGRAAWVLFSAAGESLLHMWSWRSARYFKTLN